MTTLSIGSDDEQVKFRFKAKQVIDVVGMEDGAVIAISSTEFNVIRNGSLRVIKSSDIDPLILQGFEFFEKHLHKPKYPYMVVVIDLTETKHE